MKNILLVDDEPIFNILHTKLIQRLFPSAAIHVVKDGEQALDYLETLTDQPSATPDIIMVDLYMPIMDGFDFLKAYQALKFPGKEKVVVAVLSSSNEPAHERKAKELGADYFLEKPCSDEALIRLTKDKKLLAV